MSRRPERLLHLRFLPATTRSAAQSEAGESLRSAAAVPPVGSVSPGSRVGETERRSRTARCYSSTSRTLCLRRSGQAVRSSDRSASRTAAFATGSVRTMSTSTASASDPDGPGLGSDTSWGRLTPLRLRGTLSPAAMRRLRWFGSGWDHPDLLMGNHVATPLGELCGRCGRPIEAGDQGVVTPCDPHADVQAHMLPSPAHRECSALPDA